MNLFLRRLPWKPVFRATRFSSQSALNIDEGLIVTRNCGKKIKQLQSKQNNDKLYLRISVDGGGCSGFQYKYNMEQEPLEEEDKIFERDGARVIVDEVSLGFIKGSTVDYVEEMMKSAFSIINNPNSESACGCGSSFAVKNFTANPALD